MWHDNETRTDLLGFDYLVDELEVLLTERRLLPLTIGIDGGWGSGKSSLMEMIRARLESEENAGRFVCVCFNPWRFEDFTHGKVGLMAAIVDAIAERIEEDRPRFKVAVEKANALRRRLHSWGLFRQTATVAAGAAGAGPEEAAAAGLAADVITGVGTEDAGQERPRSFETVAHFHEEFASLVESLGEDVQALVVFVDDMDRCSTETIVETFEAMRLFLQAPKTAYVIGADTAIVETALADRYPTRDDDTSRHYLEKMIQNGVSVPPLSEPDAQTYINLLFCELYTTPSEYSNLLRASTQNREPSELLVAMTDGIARETIGDLPQELSAGLEIAAQVGPPLARGLRGNPRQIKRFLNRLLLRMRTAEKRQLALDPAKLAKLMVLEELLPADFETVFRWQLDAGGAPRQLAEAERLVRGEATGESSQEVLDWLVQPGVRQWLLLQPSLAGENLGAYYTFSRDRLSRVVSAPLLPAAQQKILVALQSDLEPTRQKAVSAAAGLQDADLAEILPLLLDISMNDLTSSAAKAMLELASRSENVATAMFVALDRLPDAKIAPNFVLSLRLKFKDEPRLAPLLERWELKGSAAVQKQAQRARAGA
jgi:KAP family P-loop domain